jgi:hypothetical protein
MDLGPSIHDGARYLALCVFAFYLAAPAALAALGALAAAGEPDDDDDDVGGWKNTGMLDQHSWYARSRASPLSA